MKLVNAKSSNLHSFGYSDTTQELIVTFKAGNGGYRYKGVPRRVFEELQAAASRGKYFIANIRNSFAWDKLTQDELNAITQADSASAISPRFTWDFDCDRAVNF